MVGFDPGQMGIGMTGQRTPPPSILDAGPCKRWIEIVAAIGKAGAGLHLCGERLHRGDVGCPDGCSQAKITIVHQLHRLCVAVHRHDADHRAKAFFCYLMVTEEAKKLLFGRGANTVSRTND